MVYLHHTDLMPYQADFKSSDNYAMKINYFVPFKDRMDGIDDNWIGARSYTVKGRQYFSDICEQITQSRDAMFASLEMSGYRVSSFTMDTEWRFLPGLGSAHIHEASLNLHHVYGVPYLNGSGCKGIARQYALELLEADILKEMSDQSPLYLGCLEKLLEAEQKLLEKSLADQERLRNLSRAVEGSRDNRQEHFLPPEALACIMGNSDIRHTLACLRRIFGNQEQKGSVVFMDAFPQHLETAACIMSPHYIKYYGGSSWPVDQDVIPFKFLSVQNATYIFALAVSSNAGNGTGDLEQARDFLKDALSDLGAGAKNAVNYGYFTGYHDRTTAIRKQANDRVVQAITFEERINADLCSVTFQDVAKAVVTIHQETEHFSDADRESALQKAGQWMMKDLDVLKSCNNDEFDAIVVEKILPDIPEDDGKASFAETLLSIKRIKNNYQEKIIPFLPVRDNSKLIDELIAGLNSKPDSNKINQAKNILQDDVLSLDEKKQVAEYLLGINSPKKEIKKALKKAQKEAQKWK